MSDIPASEAADEHVATLPASDRAVLVDRLLDLPPQERDEAIRRLVEAGRRLRDEDLLKAGGKAGLPGRHSTCSTRSQALRDADADL